MIFEKSIVMAGPFENVLAKVKEVLKSEGFGVLTEIDIQAVLAARIGKHIDRYVIVGACNPVIAARALDLEPQIGVLLPCNVVVRQSGEGVLVEAMDPGVISTLVANKELDPIVDEARRLLANAFGGLSPADA